MRIQRAGLRERFSTCDTNIRPLSRVHPHVPQQNRVYGEPSSTHRAHIRTFSGVISHVVLQLHDGRETFLAHGTFYRLLGAVQSFVASQIARLTECFSTEIADKWPLICVSTHVNF